MATLGVKGLNLYCNFAIIVLSSDLNKNVKQA